MVMKPRILEIRKGVLEKNNGLATNLRQRFRNAGVLVLNLVSSPGTGKTALLELTLAQLLAQGYQAAALVGDLATENDAKRLVRSGAPVRQIVTGGNCHLEADMISNHLDDWKIDLEALDFLFIENVGNLVCPTHYDLGEDIRVVLLSVTEGEDKPLKYPPMFNSADIAIITKLDIADAVEFERDLAIANIQNVSPNITILETSAKKGTGMAKWLTYLIKAKQQMQTVSEC
ncbi:MAG: hydrogenase nickel incorporation protein HypB [Chloroflexota bacterium]